MPSFSSFWQVLHDITIICTQYFHILYHLQAMMKIFLKLFLICMFKDQNLERKNYKLAENILKNLTLWSFWSWFFPSLLSPCPLHHWYWYRPLSLWWQYGQHNFWLYRIKRSFITGQNFAFWDASIYIVVTV